MKQTQKFKTQKIEIYRAKTKQGKEAKSLDIKRGNPNISTVARIQCVELQRNYEKIKGIPFWFQYKEKHYKPKEWALRLHKVQNNGGEWDMKRLQ